MNKNGPIIVIEDDIDDQQLMQDMVSELSLGNELMIFSSAELALTYLRTTEVKPFLILSDINMPGLNGFQMRELIMEEPQLKVKCIPFVFCTTGATAEVVNKAYEQSVQGIFQKPSQYTEWLSILGAIIDYWKHAMSPNRYA